MTETGQSTDPPTDPNAPTTHTLPSGKIVEVRSHRTLTGLDVATAIAAQTGVGARGVVDARTALAALLITEIEPGTGGKPVLDGTGAAVLAQRGDDFAALFNLVTAAFRVAMGYDNIIDDYEAHADPKADTSPPSGPSPASEDASRP